MITNQHILVNESMASGGANQKFPSFQIFRLAAGGLGGAAQKNERKFLGLPRGACPRRAESVVLFKMGSRKG